MKKREMNRRDFIKWGSSLAALGIAGAVLPGCGGSKDPCRDLTGLTDEEKQTRVTFAYRDKTLIPAKRCDNCHFYVAPVGGSPCATCTVVKGPVTLAGYCNAWVEPQPEGAPEPEIPGAPAEG
ncbi:high-potential iron-sulfur protein [bacterium]|nr:high-potential iron-sulfur protein [bacterium]